MRAPNETVRSAVLEAGKAEFLTRGFTKASLRSIASAAGVTTGAIYTYFPDKAAIFDALVAEPAEALRKQYSESVSRMDQTLQQDITPWREWVDVDPDRLIDFLYAHFDAFRLLTCCAAGTRYEDYIHSLVELETESTVRFIGYLQKQGVLNRELDAEVIHITVSTHYAGIFEPIAHQMPKEQALRCVRILEEFYAAGWQKILGY
ncbi:TetR/AcrR family transcriptional regulator [Oscillospiraceae bacterium OttesenSCG-928-F05]|nr:TetR/AcrR family transcriptional regulator [Oscillospiraceae bacterium OttesenSCG-928-F05]